MSSLALERKCSVTPSAALRMAVGALTRLGYEAVSTSDSEMHLLYSKGSVSSVRLPDFRHRLTITADGVGLRFLFEAGFSHGGLVIASERDELEKRVDAVMLAVLDGAKPSERPRAARCPVCATLAPDGANACPMCGFALS